MKYVLLLSCLLTGMIANAQSFVHPGLNQTAADLAYMKSCILKGQEPWKSAYERMKAATDTMHHAGAYTHVYRGPYGKPNIGGDALSHDANLAYNAALLWYITGEQGYADKAIGAINAWSERLWDFDYNDAKLLAAWTGHVFCNAAELLRDNRSGWKTVDRERFRHMLQTVYYPLLRFYYPQANGNWDGAIIHTLLAIAVYTDNRELFNNGVDHFLHGPVNGSVFKYIYPSGQCQESIRDQAHVQLGLGEFAGAAQIAYTQGVDLFSIANNRIALGYEYTAGFLLGQPTHCYGVISERAKTLRDDYEYVYRHYQAQGIYLPNTQKAADSVRATASRSVLTATRVPAGKENQRHTAPAASVIGYIAGATFQAGNLLKDVIRVSPGASIQEALDKAALSKGTVLVTKGIHTLPATLRIPSGVTLAGEGLGTVLFLDPASGMRDAIVNASEDLHDVTIRDLVIEGAVKTDPGTDPNGSRSFKPAGNRGGIIFRASDAVRMRGLRLQRVTIQNCTFNGLLISGADDVQLDRCDFSENGSSVVPGPRLQHNVLLTHCNRIALRSSRLATSPFGSGLSLSECTQGTVDSCEIARNAWYGATLSGCKDIVLQHCLVEGNDNGGILLESLYTGNEQVQISNNQMQFNAGESVAATGCMRCQLQDHPQTFLLNPAVLQQHLQRIQNGDTVLLAALNGVKKAAEKILQQPVYSVMLKQKTPPSGDKHDYMSVGPYWWPDSTQPDGLPYIRRDGQVNPERFGIQDAEYYTALCKDVYTLGVAWYYTRDPRYATHAAKMVRTWFLDPATRMNPHLNFAQAIPGITEGRGIGLIDTHNTPLLLDGLQLLKPAPELPAADFIGIQTWYRRFLEWMRTSPIGLDEADELNNHGTWYDVQAVSIALFTGQPALAASILERDTKSRIDRQLEPDGRQPLELARTLSWNYSQMNLQGFHQLAQLAEKVNIDLWHYQSPGKKSLEKAFTWMLPFAVGQYPWIYQQIKPMSTGGFLELAMTARSRYPQVDLSALWQRNSFVPGDLYRLTYPLD